jgi:hypothetical protein
VLRRTFVQLSIDLLHRLSAYCGRMKRTLVATLVLPGMLAFSVVAQGQTMKLGELLVLTPSDGKPRPASNAYLLQADRGSRKGQFLEVRTTDAKSGAAAGLPTGSTGYQLIAPEKAGPLPEVNVLGIHYIKVRPDRSEAFERFVRDTIHPAVANLRPDLRLLYYKAVRGTETGSYIALFALTRESRDKYWPGGSDSDDLRAAFKPVQQHTKELGTYFVEGSALTDPKFAAAVYESREWTDFVLVAPAAK